MPTTLVAAFRATLEEVTEADLLLHVIDISHPNAIAQSFAVFQTLREIGASHIPVINVLNKIDLLGNSEHAQDSLAGFENTIAISALKNIGIVDLLQTVHQFLFEKEYPVSLKIPYSEGNILNLMHHYGIVQSIEYKTQYVLLRGCLPGRHLAKIHPYLSKRQADQKSSKEFDI